jgi:GMP synthase-like glutamine amidotransferase
MARGEWICGLRNNEFYEERWGFYDIYDFRYPSDIELSKLRAIIIPGSPACCLEIDKNPWMINLCEFIRKVYVQFKNIKLLGICFGS